MEYGGRDWSDSSGSQEHLWPPEAERGNEAAHLKTLEGRGPDNIWISGF